MFLKELENYKPKNIKIGSVVYIVRRLSGHVEETKLIDVRDTSRVVVLEWNPRYKYQVNLDKNEIKALNCLEKHRLEMKRMWYVWEPHVMLLIKTFYSANIEMKAPKKAFDYRSVQPPEYKHPVDENEF